MKTFLKMTLATVTGLLLTGILFFVIMLASLSALVASGNKPAEIPEKSVLVLKTGNPVPDRTSSNPFTSFDPVSMKLIKQTPGLNDILANLKKAADDKDISGVLIENGVIPAGWATADEIQK